MTDIKTKISTVLVLMTCFFLISCTHEIPPQSVKKNTVKRERDNSVLSLIEHDKLMDQVLALLAQKTQTDRPIWQAITVLEDMLKKAPQHAYAARLLASLLVQAKENEKATKKYQAYLALFPTDTNTRFTLAKLYLKQDRTEASEDQLKHIILSDPETWMPYQLLAEIATIQGDIINAQAYAQTAKKLKEQGKPAKPGIVILQKYLSPQRTQALLASMENHPKINPKLKPLQNFVK